MSKRRGINIDYYEVWSYKEISKDKYEENKCDISDILIHLKDSDINDRTFEYNDEKIRVQEVKYHEVDDIWEIQLLRARKYIAPGIADDSGNYSIMVLDGDKYYAESVTLLYDAKRCIIAMQINHNFITRTILEKIFEKFQQNLTNVVQLRPIIIPDSKNKIKNAKYCTRLSVTVRPSIGEENSDNKTLFGMLFGTTQKFRGSQCKIEIGFGRNLKKKNTLNLEEIEKVINEMEKVSGIEDLEIDYKNEEGSLVDKVSLIKERIKDVIVIDVEKNKPIVHEIIFQKIKEKYLNRIKNNMI